MGRVFLACVALLLVVYNADDANAALNCPACEYSDPEKDIGMSEEDKGLAACKTGGSSIPTIECPAPATGNKAACMRGKASVTLTVNILGENMEFDMAMYIRDCYEVTEDQEAEGTIPDAFLRSLINHELDNSFNDTSQMSAEVNSMVAKYCTTDQCGASEDITGLSGVSSTLPSLLTLALLALLSTSLYQ